MTDESGAAELAMASVGDPGNRWSIDRRIPLALIIALVAQFAGVCVGAGIMYDKLDSHSVSIARLEVSGAARDGVQQKMQIDMALIGQRLTDLVDHQVRQDQGRL